MARTSKLTAVSTVMLREKDDAHSTIEGVEIRLYLAENLDPKAYFDSEGKPVHASIKPTTQCFIQGLLANLHYAHQQGFWDSADHLRYIVRELERGFIRVANVGTSEPY